MSGSSSSKANGQTYCANAARESSAPRDFLSHYHLAFYKSAHYSEHMGHEIGSLLSDAARLLRKRFDAATRGHNVTAAQWRVLLNLFRRPGLSQGQLAEALEVEPITTCRMVDRLVQAGLVERRHSAADRRVWNIYLTQAAHPLIDTVRDVGDAVVDQALTGFSEEEKATLSGSLARMRANLLNDAFYRPEKKERRG